MRDMLRGQRPALLLPFLAVLAVYGQTLAFPFVWDDPGLLAHVREAARRGGAAGLLSADYGYTHEQVGYWRPVTTLSLWLDDLLTPSPWVFHATNVLFYLGCVLLLYLLGRSLLPPGPGAFLAALFFALLPPHTESAAFVGNRHDLLALLFALWGMLAWARDREGRRPLSLAAGAAAAALAGLSKESALVFPAIPLLFDLIDQWDRPRPPGLPAAWWGRNRRWLFAFGAGVGSALLLRLFLFPGGFGVAGGVVGHSLGDPLLWISRIAFYLSLLAVPWPVKVGYSVAETMLTLSTAAGCLFFLLLAGAAAGPRRERWGLKAAAWAGILLLPVAGLVPIGGEVAAARHVFAASAGPCLLAGYLFGRRARDGGGRTGGRGWSPILAGGTAAMLAAALAAASFMQARVWRDEVALFSRMAQDAPSSRIPFINLGDALLRAGRPEEALAASRRAIELAPYSHKAHYNLAVAMERLGRFAEAEEALRRAVGLAPDDPALLIRLGRFLGRRGRFGDEVRVLEDALLLVPDDPAAWTGLGDALGRMKRYREAVPALERSLALDPGNAETRRLLVMALLGTGETERAREEWARLRRLDPAAAAEVAPFVP